MYKISPAFRAASFSVVRRRRRSRSQDLRGNVPTRRIFRQMCGQMENPNGKINESILNFVGLGRIPGHWFLPQ
jgi:hypothetical protein